MTRKGTADSRGFVRTDGRYFTRNGKRFFPIGVNYLPSYLCGNHFADYRTRHINADLDHIKELGLDCVRVAVFWNAFEPKEAQYSTQFLDAFKQFVSECKKRGILVMPVFLIGTWTGMHDAPYWKPPGMYQGEMLELEARHIAEFIRHFADDPAILCWDLSDEPWYLEEIPPSPLRKATGLPPSRRDIATNWVARLCKAIREVDSNHLITLGADPEPVRKDTGFALEEMARHLDVMAYCIYPLPSYGIELDLISYGAFQTRFFAAGGKPPFLHEGPGVSSSAANERLIADRFRAWMYSSLANGNIGVLPWCYTDYQEKQHYTWPLDDKPQEPNFGICLPDHTLKPQAEEFLKFAQDVRRLPLDELQLEQPRAAFIYPCDYYEKSGQLHAKFWRHFTLAKGANISIDLVREDCIPTDMKLLIVPGFPLHLSTWNKLRTFVRNGGHLLMIMDEFFCLNPMSPELFGVSVDGLRPGTATATFDQKWGQVAKGSRLLFRDKAQRLWVKPDSAKTVAAFEDGWPFLLVNNLGKGKAYLATIPFPLYLDLENPTDKTVVTAINILRQIRDDAGCRPTVDTVQPWIETAIFRSTRKGADWAVVTNYARTPCNCDISFSGRYSAIEDSHGTHIPAKQMKSELRISLRLDANGAAILRLVR